MRIGNKSNQYILTIKTRNNEKDIINFLCIIADDDFLPKARVGRCRELFFM